MKHPLYIVKDESGRNWEANTVRELRLVLLLSDMSEEERDNCVIYRRFTVQELIERGNK